MDVLLLLEQRLLERVGDRRLARPWQAGNPQHERILGKPGSSRIRIEQALLLQPDVAAGIGAALAAVETPTKDQRFLAGEIPSAATRREERPAD